MTTDPNPSTAVGDALVMGAAEPIEARIAAAGLPPLPRSAWLEVDLGVLAANAGRLRTVLSPETRLGVVVKADGYGHGMVGAARAAIRGGAGMLLVATLDEALVLREAGFTARILVLYPVPAGQLAGAVAADLDLVVVDDGSTAAMVALLGSGQGAGTTGNAPGWAAARVHLGIDTGMARGGVAPDRVVDVARTLIDAGLGRLTGTWSHLATPEDPAFLAAQVARFDTALERLAAARIDPGLRHIGATGGLLGGAPAYDMVRVGLAWYGIVPPELAPGDDGRAPGASLRAAVASRPAISLRARAVAVAPLPAGASVGYGGTWTAARPTVVATLPLGYADGWTRAYATGSWAIVRGRRVALIGRVSSDAIALDVTDVPAFGPADEVVLLDGAGGAMDVHSLAALRSSISWEVLDAFSPRLARVYTDGPRVVGVRYLDGRTTFADGDPGG